MGIHPDLVSLAFPVALLEPLPGNPRQGDVGAVARSYAAFGQRKPIVGRKQGDGGIVIAGNHQLEAAKRLGWEEIAVVWVEDDDLTATAFALADNHTADLGTYDNDLLAQMLSYVADDEALLAATAYTPDDIEKLVHGVEHMNQNLDSAWAVVVVCRDEGQQVELIRRFTEEGLECRALVS